MRKMKGEQKWEKLMNLQVKLNILNEQVNTYFISFVSYKRDM